MVDKKNLWILSENNLEIKYQSTTIWSLDTYLDLAKKLGKSKRNFVYRGQSNCNWSLSTSLERELAKAINLRSSLATPSKISYEDRILHQFQSNPGYSRIAIRELLTNEALKIAFVQHYGGPTRLLDFTKAIDKALFFAIAAMQPEDAAVWAVSLKPYEWFGGLSEKSSSYEWPTTEEQQYNMFLKSLTGTANIPSGISYLAPNIKAFNRLQAQEGLFLYPSNFSKLFVENLLILDREEPEPIPTQVKFYELSLSTELNQVDILKVRVKYSRDIFLTLLHYLSNNDVNFPTLFPPDRARGSEGLMRDFQTQLFLQFQTGEF